MLWSRKCLLLAVSLLFICSAESQVLGFRDDFGYKIVGGKQVEIEEFPYQVAIEGGSVLFICGGSIISPNWVLTAAHCVYKENISWLRVRAGSSKFRKEGRLHKVKTIIWHYLYEPSFNDYDVGLILVKQKFQNLPNIRPIPLSTVPAVAGDSVTAAGWGYLEEQRHHRPSKLMAVNLTVVDWSLCRQQYEFLTPRQMCVMGIKKDTCYGDSGGAIVSNGKQVGIVSTGFRCAGHGLPGIYVNITVVGPWIEEITRIYMEKSDPVVFPRDE